MTLVRERGGIRERGKRWKERRLLKAPPAILGPTLSWYYNTIVGTVMQTVLWKCQKFIWVHSFDHQCCYLS